jgi:cell fate regulator YaaT (PSP1 superfamily)
LTHTDLPSPDSKDKDSEKSETPILMLKSDCKSVYKNLIVNSIREKNSNVSGCFYCGLSKYDKVPVDKRNVIEISCNGLIHSNFVVLPETSDQKVFPEDFIVIQNEEALEIAQVKLIGELVKIKRQYFGLMGEDLPNVVRKASIEDIERVRKNLHDEQRAIDVFKNAITKFNLDMKLVSIHFQFDRKRLFFFYTADGRIDFRELAKELANVFKTRIELRQIGVRDEAKKVGGLGSCGREYCCLSFLNNFKRITTQLANDQNLLTSMGKLSGPCGKLKCCLSFEVE